MNWKLLFVALACATVSISARPADETQPIEITQTPTTATAAATTREEKSTTTKSPVVAAVTSPSTIRYFPSSTMPTKPTNSKLKYSNNYANLITKYTLLNNHHNNNRNVSSDNSNQYVTLHDVVVASSSLPSLANTLERPATETTSNLSSKPLVFLSADETTTLGTTTKRDYNQPLQYNVVSPWPELFEYGNRYQQETSPRPTRRKPVIHKILSKWSDNPHDIFIGNKNDYSDEKDFTIFSTRFPKPVPNVEDLTHNLYHNVILPDLVAPSSFNGMGQMGHDIMANPLANVPKPLTKNVNKNYQQQYRPSNCKTTKIKVGNHIVNGLAISKENCDELEVQIENDIKNVNGGTTEPSTEDVYDFNINDKFQDVMGFADDSTEKTNAVLSEDIPQIINSITQIQNTRPITKDDGKKRKRKKRPQSQNQIDYEDDGGLPTMFPTMLPGGGDGGDIGSMMMTVMTMMAIFNPLNFGVWGIIVAPFAAVMLGGIAYGMYHVVGMKQIVKHVSHQAPWPVHQAPQELIVKSKIVHSPIPIKVIHKHPPSSASPHIVLAAPVQHYGVPMDSYGPPPSEAYGVPEMFMNAYDHYMRQKSKGRKKSSQAKHTHFAEPPSYFPTAKDGQRKTPNYRFRLGVRPGSTFRRLPVQTLHKLKNQN